MMRKKNHKLNDTGIWFCLICITVSNNKQQLRVNKLGNLLTKTVLNLIFQLVNFVFEYQSIFRIDIYIYEIFLHRQFYFDLDVLWWPPLSTPVISIEFFLEGFEMDFNHVFDLQKYSYYDVISFTLLYMTVYNNFATKIIQDVH